MEYQLIHYLILSGIVALAYWHGHKTGVKSGAAGMYDHLYQTGPRKNDHVIVKLEYEDRSNIKRDF